MYDDDDDDDSRTVSWGGCGYSARVRDARAQRAVGADVN